MEGLPSFLSTVVYDINLHIHLTLPHRRTCKSTDQAEPRLRTCPYLTTVIGEVVGTGGGGHGVYFCIDRGETSKTRLDKGDVPPSVDAEECACRPKATDHQRQPPGIVIWTRGDRYPERVAAGGKPQRPKPLRS